MAEFGKQRPCMLICRMERNTLLKTIRSALEGMYGRRLRGVLLYGSEARGEACADSDIDDIGNSQRGPKRTPPTQVPHVHRIYQGENRERQQATPSVFGEGRND